MMLLTRDDIIHALEKVTDPDTGTSVTQAGMISGVTVRPDGRVGFMMTIAAGEEQRKERLRQACEQAIAALPGVSNVTAVMTAEAEPGNARAQNVKQENPRTPAQWNTTPLAHVGRLLAVASGKGGVGKSTTAVNLALALAARGERVGLLDADIYGPSIPRMLGLSGAPEVKDNVIVPPHAHGISAMSMGLLVGEEAALVWRGPQMSKALHQLLRGVAWGTADRPLDTLVIDMPPGTGDVHLSLAQQAPISGAIIVTTPQEVAVADARKCIDMFRKVNVPVLGIIENMSGFADPATGKMHAIFGQGGGRKLANDQGLPYFGEIPILMALREAVDNGAKFEDAAGIYRAIAARLY